MDMRLVSPSMISLPDNSDKVRRFLSFNDSGIQFQLRKIRQNYSWKKNDPEGYQARIDQLKVLQKKCIMLDGPNGPMTYSGLWHDLKEQFGWNLQDTLSIPEADRMIPWATPPQFEARYYQNEAVDALFANAKYGPCAIELPTGSGKSRIIQEICKRNPVQTMIITPSRTITNQLYDEMVILFGKKFVGKYGDGKHEIGKLFTVCTGQSLTNVEPGMPAHDFFRQTAQFVWDESHTTPATTFEEVCLGLLGHVPLRFFLSATQMRIDESGLLLRGITGPVVYSKSFRELVNEGFLARPYFKIFKVPAYGVVGARDANQETRQQLHLNPNVNRLAADFAQKTVRIANRPTLILIDEFAQFMAIRPYLTMPFEFAHGGSTNREYGKGKDKKKLRDSLPSQYWESDVKAIVDRFNRGETKLVIGTSAIATGVDTKPAASLVYLQGGMSEIQLKQAIGRGTRIFPGKEDLVVADFKVMGSATMERHADRRVEVYKTMGDVQEYTV